MNRIQYITDFLSCLHKTKKSLFSQIHPLFERHGITPVEWLVLSHITEEPGLSIKDISQLLGTTSSAATQIVTSLVEKGYVERKESSKDRRVIHVSLSPKGQTLVKTLKKEQLIIFTAMFQAFSDQELETYFNLQAKLLSPFQKP